MRWIWRVLMPFLLAHIRCMTCSQYRRAKWEPSKIEPPAAMAEHVVVAKNCPQGAQGARRVWPGADHQDGFTPPATVSIGPS